jgi:ferritin-like metal-binding protein YciE
MSRHLSPPANGETRMSEAEAIFVTGLRNAHAMENQALSIMKPQISRIENYPDVRQRLERHVSETERQINRLEGVLEALGENKSSLKDMALSLGGSMAAIGHTIAPDEILKNNFANFAFENYEIAAYKSLIALAEQAGNSQAIGILTQNLKEEQDMADWLDQNIESVTLQYAALRENGDAAKK